MKVKFALLASVCFLAFNANALETKAKHAILMDYDTGDYLFTEEAFTPVPPASMSKLMTVYMIFSKIKDGSLSLEDTFTVSENAWRKGGASSGGSTMFLPIGEKVAVEDLLKGIIIQSGNDACIVVAENIGGSEEDFAVMMNKKANELGLNNSNFANSTGLPHPDHKMSMEDLANLGRILIKDFPEFYHLFSQKTFKYHNIVQGNRNPLLYSMSDADGLKTGHTEEAGFSLTASAKKGSRRLVSAMSGMKSNKERSEEAEKLMSWGFREFDNYAPYTAYQSVTSVPVYMGDSAKVDLVADKDIVLTLAKNKAKDAKLVAVYTTPLKAPIAQGDKVGELRIELGESEAKVFPLYADRSVNKLGFWGRIKRNIAYLFVGEK